ncbi:uncharacterized protein VICG_01741 [Vittaforma corneae ATCC 50505]|uniref:Uncharacterized protein n=1 Tax=Vittaforma corneae (strain ATCC 50505) TaxID=993615 RepID=L2GLT7_VITCO|nr:uncharacterized protein VICG_01741 [Vittaforma corneae ATCC 50505]ELA41252.1 hypothetical protein VICG_01741 [Vittaforma corneae ATCC 50505]
MTHAYIFKDEYFFAFAAVKILPKQMLFPLLANLVLATTTTEKQSITNDEFFDAKIFPSFDRFLHISSVFCLYIAQIIIGMPLLCISMFNLCFFLLCKTFQLTPKRKFDLLDSYILNSVVMCMNLSNIVFYLIYYTVALYHGDYSVFGFSTDHSMFYSIIPSILFCLFEYFIIEQSIQRKEKRKFSYGDSFGIVFLLTLFLYLATLQQFTPGFGIVRCFVTINVRTFLFYFAKIIEHILFLFMTYLLLTSHFPRTGTQPFFGEKNPDKLTSLQTLKKRMCK